MERGEHTVLWILVFGIATFISLIYDNAVLSWFAEARTKLLNYYFLEMTMIFTIPVIIGIVTLFFLKQRKLIVPWWMTALTTLALTMLVSFLLRRDRPFVLYESMAPLVKEGLYSFPSVRTAVTFSALPILAKNFPRFAPFWMVFAILIAVSRVYVGAHYLSDVFAGMLAGYLVGKMVLVTAEKTGKA